MQTRARNAIALAAAAAVLTAGLVGLARRRRVPDLRSRALDAVPAGALLVATADLAALRASPVGAPFLREGREIPGLGKVRDVCGFDPIDTLEEVAVAIPAAGDSGDFGLVASGPVDDARLIACAGKVIEARGGRPVVTTIGSFRTVRDAGLASGGEIAARKGGPLLFGAGAYLRAMIDAADGHAPTVKTSNVHGRLAREVGDAAVRVTVVLSREQRVALADELAIAGEEASPAASIVAGALGLELGAMVSVKGVVACDRADACGKLAGALKSARDARAADHATRLVGFGPVFEQLAIEVDGDMVRARTQVPAEQAVTLAERLVTLRGLRHPMPKDEAPPKGAAPPEASAPRADEIIVPDGGARPAAGDAGAAKTR